MNMISDMTMRDYFAAQFAAAMMTATSADHDFPNIDYQHEVGGQPSQSVLRPSRTAWQTQCSKRGRKS